MMRGLTLTSTVGMPFVGLLWDYCYKGPLCQPEPMCSLGRHSSQFQGPSVTLVAGLGSRGWLSCSHSYRGICPLCGIQNCTIWHCGCHICRTDHCMVGFQASYDMGGLT